MTNYYYILGIDQYASTDEIKTAYKRLALKYHPDKNIGSVHAEERFKAVNEAYHILSDPYKKEKYDLVRSYEKRQTAYQPYQTYSDKNERPYYYQRYGKHDWRKGPKYAKAPVYKIDKSYYRVQTYTIIALLVASILFIAGTAINNYYNEQDAIERALYMENQANSVEHYYQNSLYDSAFIVIRKLVREFPLEARFRKMRKDYVNRIRIKGFDFYEKKLFPQALVELNAVKDHISKQDLDVWMAIGESHFALRNYQKAINAFDYVSMREKNNLHLVMRIGDIYQALGDNELALTQYTKAKAIFKNRQASAYGDAFELVVKPQYLDTIYHDLFKVRGQLNYELSHFEEAATDYNWALFLNPEDRDSYIKRANCYLKTGNAFRACNDLREAYQRGDLSALPLIKQYCGS